MTASGAGLAGEFKGVEGGVEGVEGAAVVDEVGGDGAVAGLWRDAGEDGAGGAVGLGADGAGWGSRRVVEGGGWSGG